MHPTKKQAVLLWQAYVQNVDVFSKLLHIPTTEALFYSAINDPERASPEVRCLLFAIYFAATTSLAPDDFVAQFGQDKSAALLQFRSGLENGLAAADILERPTLMTLQAFATFIVRVSYIPNVPPLETYLLANSS